LLVRIRPPPINRRGSGGGSRWGLGNVSRARPAPGDDGDGASSMPSSSSPAGLAPGARPPETAWTGRPAATRRASFSFFPWGKELRRRCTHCARQTTAGGHLRLSGRRVILPTAGRRIPGEAGRIGARGRCRVAVARAAAVPYLSGLGRATARAIGASASLVAARGAAGEPYVRFRPEVNGKHASIGCLDWAQVPTWQLARRFPAALICWLGDIKAWMLSRSSLDPTFVARPGDVVAPTPQDRRSTSIASPRLGPKCNTLTGYSSRRPGNSGQNS